MNFFPSIFRYGTITESLTNQKSNQMQEVFPGHSILSLKILPSSTFTGSALEGSQCQICLNPEQNAEELANLKSGCERKRKERSESRVFVVQDIRCKLVLAAAHPPRLAAAPNWDPGEVEGSPVPGLLQILDPEARLQNTPSGQLTQNLASQHVKQP